METKRCTTCDQELPVGFFYARKDNAGRYSSECRGCKSKRSKLYFLEHIKRHRALVKKRYEVHGRFAKYGLSLMDYEAILIAQNGKCALCMAEAPGGKGKWHIDHLGGTIRGVRKQCESQSVRGLLCHRCNVSLGHYEKLLKRIGLENIMKYIERK